MIGGYPYFRKPLYLKSPIHPIVLERVQDLPSGRGIFLQAAATFTVKALGIFQNPIVKMKLAPQYRRSDSETSMISGEPLGLSGA